MTDKDLLARVQALEDRMAIQDAINASTLFSDLNEPKLSLAQFAEDAVIDYSSLSGPESAGIPIQEHRARLSKFLPGFKARQHRISNFDITVEGNTATVRSQCNAIHVLDGEVWEACATYHHRLARTGDGWKITYLRADMIHQTGEGLVQRAEEIVAQRRKDRKA